MRHGGYVIKITAAEPLQRQVTAHNKRRRIQPTIAREITMEIAGYVLLTAAVTVFIYGALAYNRFVMLKHNVLKAWGNIDVLLKQRHDELPKLVAPPARNT